MMRAVAVPILIVTVHVVSNGQVNAQCSCAAPPSCAVPCAPSCAAPGCASAYSGGYCSNCQACQGSRGCPRCCKKRTFNFDFSRTIIKRNLWGGLGEAPPVGFAVSSVPALTVSTPSIPISLATANNDNAVQLASAMIRMLNEDRAATAAAASASSNVCEDPCGSIKQLEDDVRQLREITVKLTLAVEELVKRQNAE